MEKYIIKVIFFSFLTLFYSKIYSQPDKKMIESNVYEHYLYYSNMVGGSSYNIKKIIIEKIEKIASDTFIVYIIVKGTEKNYTIPNDKRKKFSDKLIFKYFYNKFYNWDYITENDPRKR